MFVYLKYLKDETVSENVNFLDKQVYWCKYKPVDICKNVCTFLISV